MSKYLRAMTGLFLGRVDWAKVRGAFASAYLRIAITGLLLARVAWNTDWAKVRDAFANLNVGLWVLAVGLLIVAQLVSALRWQIFARQLGLRRGFWHLTRIYFIGMYFNLVLPTSVGGDVVRAWYLNARSGMRLRAAAAVMLDRVNGLIVLVALACVAVLFAPEGTPRWVAASVYGVAAAGVGGALALAAFVRWGRLDERRKQQVAYMWEVVRHPKWLAATTALSLVVQLLSAAIVWLVGVGLGFDVPFGYYAVLTPMVSILTLLPVSVNGMGVREEACALFLAPVGIGATSAYALAILWFVVQLTVSLMGGVAYHLGNERSVKSLPDDKEIEHESVDRGADQGRARQLNRAA